MNQPLPAVTPEDIAVAMQHVLAEETAEARAARYEATLRAILACPLLGQDRIEWEAQAIEDTLSGFSAECWQCGTAVHDGPCVAESGASA